MENFFKDKLKELRIEKGLSQDGLAKAIGSYRANVAEWESGKGRPTMHYIITLARFFDVTTDYLLGLEHEDGSKVK